MTPTTPEPIPEADLSTGLSRLRDWAAWVLAGTLFLIVTVTSHLTPLGVGANPLTYDDVAVPRFAVALVGAALSWLLLAVVSWRTGSFSFDTTWLLLLGLGLWSIISAVASDSIVVWLGQSERLEGVVGILLYGVFFGAGLQVGRLPHHVRWMARAVATGGAILAVHGMFQVAGFAKVSDLASGSFAYLGAAFASLTNPNFLAALLVLTVPISAGLGLTSRHVAAKVVWWVATAVSVVAIYFTYAQGAWLALVFETSAGIGLWIWSSRTGRRRAGRRQPHAWAKTLVPTIVVAGIGVALIFVTTSGATQRGLSIWGEDLPESAAGRVLLLQTTASAIAQSPLTGFGPDNFLEAFRLYRSDRYMDAYGITSTNNNAHSWLLQYAANLGIPGALLLAGALVFGFMRSRPRIAVRLGETDDVLRAAIWTGAAGFILQLMFNVSMLASTLPFWSLLGAISAPYARRAALPRPVGVTSVALVAVLLATAIFGSVRVVQADMTYVTARFVYRGLKTGDAVVLTEKAARLNPLSLKYSRAVAQARAAVLYKALAEPGVPEATARQLYADAKRAFDQTLAESPNDYAALAWLAALQTFTGTYLNDQELLAAARTTAQQAAAMDRANSEVVPLLRGETDAAAIESALSAPALP